jgi:hypothetical protein
VYGIGSVFIIGNFIDVWQVFHFGDGGIDSDAWGVF